MVDDANQHWRKVHKRMNEHLLFAEDLGGLGCAPRDLEVVDSGVAAVKDGDGKSKPMPWLAFKGAKKKLALNVTNCKTMESLCGTGVVAQWRGPVTLLVVETTFHDQKTKTMQTTAAIRISTRRPRMPSGKTEKSPPPADAKPAPASTEQAAPADPDADLEPMTDAERRAIELAEREENPDA